jgi:hypothetical protein
MSSAEAVIISFLAVLASLMTLFANALLFYADVRLTIRMKEPILEVHTKIGDLTKDPDDQSGPFRTVSVTLCNKGDGPAKLGKLLLENRKSKEREDITNVCFASHWERKYERDIIHLGKMKYLRITYSSSGLNSLETKEKVALLELKTNDETIFNDVYEFLQSYDLVVEIKNRIIRLRSRNVLPAVEEAVEERRVTLNGDDPDSDRPDHKPPKFIPTSFLASHSSTSLF